MNLKNITILTITGLLYSCTGEQSSEKKTEIEFQNIGHEIVHTMVQKVGNFDMLASKKNVSYTYIYTTPDGKKDVSQEKYMFKGELSYGKYTTHERTIPELEGELEQGYDGTGFWLKHDGELVSNYEYLKKVAFNRPTNFYWFTMMQKLLDPGLNYEYLNDTTINSTEYDVVKVSFQPQGDKPTDIYQLYINKKTNLVDQFLFTVADFGKIEIPFLMQLEYEKVDDLLIPVKRQYKPSSWDAFVSDKPWIYVTWTDIQFDTDITQKDFQK